ncbi:DNA mismatch repair protein mutS [Coccidioides immitis RMSCC 3703]|uniref:DNA mismatch repair protein MSH3 n=1 Tax=Coccidioides immitis RMSCC 3703 TaxID=454286 RepID=A0A0J8QSX7_COCIT|nr:DNA mismatch repair protein mutS [Coccidioides immitis RMSCC 3703]
MMRAIVRNARTLRVPPFRHSPTSTFCALSGHEVFSRSVIRQSSCRGAKTKASIKLKDLAQGRLGSLEPPLTATNDSPQYPSVIQGAKNNMLKFKNCVLLTRVGGFYELYLEQAEEFAPLLNLKLACKKTSGGSVPMAGFPFYQLDRFLKILVQDLQKYVAISEEFTNNITEKAKSGGLMFDRKVARIVTPGTLIDEKFMDHYENNFLLALYVNTSDMQKETKAMARPSPDQLFSSSHSHPVGLSWLDLSTGDFFTQYTTRLMLPSALSRIGAKEIILDERLNDSLKQEMQNLVGQDHRLLTCFRSQDIKPMSDWSECFETPIPRELAATFTVEETAACHILLEYVQVQMQGVGVKLQAPRRKHLEETMAIDRNSLKGLEILETARDGLGKGSLLHAVRRTSTKSGARLLRDRLTSPSASLPVINERLDLVSEFIEDIELEESITSLLKRSYDAQRLVQKFSLGRADADDIYAIKGYRCIKPNKTIDEEALLRKQRMEEEDAADAAALAHEVIANEGSPEDLESMPKRVKSQRTGKSKDLSDSEADEQNSWIMQRDASVTLQRLHKSLESLYAEKASLTDRLRKDSKTASLCLKWTPGLGHIVHMKGSKAMAQSLDVLGVHRTVSSSKSTRSFHLPSWTKLGARIDEMKLQIRSEEQRIFKSLREDVIRNLVKLRRNAAVLDELDVACSFASLAREQRLTRPILNMGYSHKIIGGRHPTVKLGLEEKGRPFVNNDCFIGGQERIWLITGPNMAGKSTFLRQNALITILAQVGSFVPAEYAELGMVDQIFSRIGAADDLFRDQSTFMVEMLETAAILKHASRRSFVIMDEVGRGTAPEDGIAIGFACLQHLHDVSKCRTLFATHFHSLAEMTSNFGNLGRYCTSIVEDTDGSFSFIHKLQRGVNRNSHALKVARLAGVPQSVIDVAEAVLNDISLMSSQPEARERERSAIVSVKS